MNKKIEYIYFCTLFVSLFLFSCNPIIIEGVLYASTAGSKIVALEAATGNKIWEYDPTSSGKEINAGVGGTNQGLTYWEDGSDKRLFYCVVNEIQAIDATTGTRIDEFGINGAVDLRDGLDRDINNESAYIRNTSPGVIYKDLIIMGSSLEGTHGSLPGHLRAYDVRSGELKWIFHTIPHPGELGYDTWPKESHDNIMNQIKGYTLGSIYTPPSIGGNIQLPGFRGGAEWSGGAFDPETGIIYIGLNDMPPSLLMASSLL